MTEGKLREVTQFYYHELDTIKPARNSISLLSHVRWMCEEIPTLLLAGRKEKAFRWLGFIQGVLVAEKWFTIDQVKSHSRSEKEIQ